MYQTLEAIFKNLVIEGFDVGIEARGRIPDLTFENVDVSGNRQAGIRVIGRSNTIEDFILHFGFPVGLKARELILFFERIRTLGITDRLPFVNALMSNEWQNQVAHPDLLYRNLYMLSEGKVQHIIAWLRRRT